MAKQGFDAAYETRRKLLDAARDRLTGAQDLSEIMDVVRTTARAIFGADGVTFVLREGNFCHYAQEDAIGPLWKGQRFPAATCISGWCMINNKTAAIEDIFEDSRIPHDVYQRTFVKSLIMTPVGNGTSVAAIGAYWNERRNHNAIEIQLVEDLAAAVAQAMQKTKAA